MSNSVSNKLSVAVVSDLFAPYTATNRPKFDAHVTARAEHVLKQMEDDLRASGFIV